MLQLNLDGKNGYVLTKNLILVGTKLMKLSSEESMKGENAHNCLRYLGKTAIFL